MVLEEGKRSMIISLSDRQPFIQESVFEAVNTSNLLPSIWSNPSSQFTVSDSLLNKARKVSLNSYYSNFVYRKLINLIADTLITAGFEFSIADEVQDKFNSFWYSFPNNVDKNLRKMLIEYLILGEMYWVFSSNPMNDKIYLSTISPLVVKEVKGNPTDSRQIGSFVVDTGEELKEFKQLEFKPTEDKIVGDGYAFAFGRFGDQLRGTPSFIASLDFLNEFQTFAYAYLRGSAFRNSIWFKVTYSGATMEELENWEKMKGRFPPMPNSVIASNERVSWDLLDPRNTSTDSQAAFLMNMIINSTDIPAFLFNGELPNNFSIYSGMQNLAAIQDALANDFSIIAKMVTGDLNARCIPGQLVTKDVQRLSGSILRLVNATLAALDKGLLTGDEGKMAIKKLYDLIGIEVGQND